MDNRMIPPACPAIPQESVYVFRSGFQIPAIPAAVFIKVNDPGFESWQLICIKGYNGKLP